ncbi:Fanconi anemia group M protein isoform X3 [Cherax quadricarinatus]|uniref:Fanconi anemia group M protein isoform X3 n=1 Tax=Cherax quadricarinatus TaxID=27406 RepID=UPI002379B2D6|nr:uncharacterized protein LOC128695445 isoform X3 [Cherax quadricarinatus]
MAEKDNTEIDNKNCSVNFDCDIFGDDDDDIIAQAFEDSLLVENVDTKKSEVSVLNHGSKDPKEGGQSHSHPSVPESTPLESLPGFDEDAGRTWIYPINYPIRDYQYCIVEKALYKNTLVSLPTGLGKTFIAAVVMYNFYRWYPQSKIVFMAPTKPLVAQQVEACFNIMGIPQEDTSQMTGTMSLENRAKAWTQKRIFFLTPQVLTNDLTRGVCPGTLIKCLVLDEAHRATGNYSYCQVIHVLRQHRHDFRILALSATPGTDVRAVQQVLTNLMISHIELRSEDSPDIQAYVFHRSIEKIVVPLGNELSILKKRYLNVLKVYISKLLDMKVLYTKDETTLSKFQIFQAREAFRQNPPDSLPRERYGVVHGLFALCITLYHSYELMLKHGTRSFYTFLKGTLDSKNGNSLARFELLRNQNFKELMEELSQKFDIKSNLSESSKGESSGMFSKIGGPQSSEVKCELPYVSHPKLTKLLTIVVDHHKKFAAEGKSTKIMIFSQYRDSVQEITEMLQLQHPLVKAMCFMGQSTGVRGDRGFSQKEQLKVVKEFREGGFNTLISTCVGEEGLDIGDVDLIVCFDSPKSPIRLVQRMGRTGRKREGRIVVLVTEGKEAQAYDQSQYQKRSVNAALADMNRLNRFLSQHSSRMVPRGITPVCLKLHMKVGTWKAQKGRGSKSSAGSTASVSSMFNNSGKSLINKKKACKNDGWLSKEELAWWRDNLQVPLDEVKSLPRPSLFCLGKQEMEEDFNSEGYINLGKYQSWQTIAQGTHVIGHSSRSFNLVQLTEFIGLQQHFDADEDPYGLEMASFLDKAYIEGNTAHRSSLFSSIKSDASRDNQHTVILQGNCEIKKGKGSKKSVPKGKKAKKTTQSSLITTMFTQRPRAHVEEQTQNFQDLDDFQNKETNNEKFKVIKEVEEIEKKDPVLDVNPSTSTSKENTDVCERVLDFLTLLPPRQQSPLHIALPPSESDFSSDNQEIELPSPTDIITVCNEWIEKKRDTMKNLYQFEKIVLSASDIRKSKPLALTDADDSLEDLPDLIGDQENTDKMPSVTEVSLQAISPVLRSKRTPTACQTGINQFSTEKIEKEPVTSPNIFDDTTTPSDKNVSPVLSSTYKKPVRTNLTLWSSTPKVTAKRLFKLATPDLTVIESHSPVYKNIEKSCTPVKSVVAADIRREKLTQGNLKNNEPEASGSHSMIDYRSKIHTKLSRFALPESLKSKNNIEILVQDCSLSSEINKADAINNSIEINKADAVNNSTEISKADAVNNSIENSVNFNLSLDDLFADREEDQLGKIESVTPNKPSATESSKNLTRRDIKPCERMTSTLLSVTEILDLVNESDGKTVDDTGVMSSHHSLENTNELMGNTSKSLFSKADNCKQSDNKTMFSKTAKQMNCLVGPNFSLLDDLVSDIEDGAEVVKTNESISEQSVQFHLLGTEEFDLMTTSVLSDEGNKAPRKECTIIDGLSWVNTDKQNLDKMLNDKKNPNIEIQADYETKFNVPHNKSPVRLSVTDTVFSPSQESPQNWQRKRKRLDVIESDSEDQVAGSSSSSSNIQMLTKSTTSSSDRSSTFGDTGWISRNKKRRLGIAVNLEDDSDFKEASTAAYEQTKQKLENVNKEQHKNMKKINVFIEDEAQLSADGYDVSSDEREDDEDDYDKSFVDDCIQQSQDAAVDMKAVYLQSVVSPVMVAHQNRHYLRPPPQHLSDTDESIHEIDGDEDSFVVDNNFVEYDTEYLGDTMLAEDPIMAQALHDEMIAKKIKNDKNGNKRKRIIVQESSSDEDSVIDDKKTKRGTTSLKQNYKDCSISLPKPFGIIQGQDFILESNTAQMKSASNNLSDVENPLDVSPSSKNSDHAQTTMTKKIILPTASDQSILSKSSQFSVAVIVLVNSCEISNASRIVSKLKHEYGASTAVVQLANAHYMVSTRMAVTRLLHSVFSNCQQRAKLVQRVQGMLDLYDRPVIIVEMDRLKPGESSHRGKIRSKYLDTIACACTQVTQLKVLYSSGQEETASVLLKLAQQESSKGYSIPVNPEHVTKAKQVVNFYLTLPHISYVTALCLAVNFRNVADFINSSAETVRDKGRISLQKATAIKQYLCRGFRPDMLPPQ